MFRTPRPILALALSAVLAPLAACTTTGGSDGESDTGISCPRGETLVNGRCRPTSSRRDAGPDTTPGEEDADSDTSPDQDVTGSEDAPQDTGPISCTPSSRSCASNGVIRICNNEGDGFTEETCAAGTRCSDVSGTCIPATDITCTPGEAIACESLTELRRCNVSGDGYTTVPCPSASPNCRDGACTNQICTPGITSCDGNDLIRCLPDGSAWSGPEQTCASGCAGGQCVDPCAGGGKLGYIGCDFWAVDLDNAPGSGPTPGADSQQFAVTVSNGGLQPVEVTVTNGSGTAITTQTIPVGDLRSIDLPRLDVDGTSLTYNSYRIRSNGPVTVHQFNPKNRGEVFSNDASLLLPANALGTEYLVLGWPSFGQRDPFGGVNQRTSFMTVVASAAGTTQVTVRPPATVSLQNATGVPTPRAGQSWTYTLAEGQVLNFVPVLPQGAAGAVLTADMTGTLITADKPVAVFAGSECANVPLDTSFCDHLEQQIFPVDTWGTTYVGAKFKARGREKDVYRVLGSVDGTTITTQPPIAGINGTTVNRGTFIEFLTDQDFVLTASQPVLVGQFMVGSAYPGRNQGCDPNNLVTTGCLIPRSSSCSNGTAIGDPAFTLSVPVNQFRSDYTLLTPAEYREDYLTIIAPIGATVQLDGGPIAGTPTAVAGQWNVWRITVADGVHQLVGSAPFGLVAYGYDCDVSYAYPGGLDLVR